MGYLIDTILLLSFYTFENFSETKRQREQEEQRQRQVEEETRREKMLEEQRKEKEQEEKRLKESKFSRGPTKCLVAFLISLQ